MQKITGIILAGGKSSRMGQDKGLLHLKGKHLIEYSIDALSPICSEIIIVANIEGYTKFGLKVVNDIFSDKGPMGGIYTGLFHSKTEVNLVLSSDTPFVTTDYLKWLITNHSSSITFSAWENKTHPLFSVFDKSTLELLNEQIKKNELKLMSLQTREEVQVVNAKENPIFEERIFTNLNTQTELNNLINGSKG